MSGRYPVPEAIDVALRDDDVRRIAAATVDEIEERGAAMATLRQQVEERDARIIELEAERDAIRRQAEGASADLHAARLAHQDELGQAAETELRLQTRITELEQLVEQMRCDREADADEAAANHAAAVAKIEGGNG